jgi:hypothetical protein
MGDSIRRRTWREYRQWRAVCAAKAPPMFIIGGAKEQEVAMSYLTCSPFVESITPSSTQLESNASGRSMEGLCHGREK